MLAQPPLYARCREKASVWEVVKATREAFSTPPHEPSARCVDTCNNPLECKEEWDRWQKGLST